MKLTDSQLIVLSAASRHPQLSVLPLPAKQAGNADRILGPLLKKKLIAEQVVGEGPHAIPVYRTDKRGRRLGLVVTAAGLQELGVEPEGGAIGPNGGNAGAPTASGASEANDAATDAAATSGAKPARRPKASRGKPASKGKAVPRTSAAAMPRDGSKLARLITLLRRKDGATVDQIAKALDWQRHTVRGAIAGALRKKLGLDITSEKVEGGERVYRIVD